MKPDETTEELTKGARLVGSQRKTVRIGERVEGVEGFRELQPLQPPTPSTVITRIAVCL